MRVALQQSIVPLVTPSCWSLMRYRSRYPMNGHPYGKLPGFLRAVDVVLEAVALNLL
jgi:hypothetical protein